MIKLSILPKHLIEEYWPQLEEWVKNALGKDKSFTVQDIKSICLGYLTLWVIHKDGALVGFLTTTIHKAPQGNVCTCPWLGGKDLTEWVQEMFEQLKNYCKSQECISLSWIGRRAWEKMLRVDYSGQYYLINL